MINPGRMEQELRALARRAERLLSEHAARHNVAWSFRVWRGSIDSELLAADIEAGGLAHHLSEFTERRFDVSPD